MNNDSKLMQRLLAETLRYSAARLEAGECTAEEVASLTKMVNENVEVLGTAQDIASYTGQSVENVRNVIHRHYIPESKKPKRKVLYNFMWFLGNAPSKWVK